MYLFDTNRACFSIAPMQTPQIKMMVLVISLCYMLICSCIMLFYRQVKEEEEQSTLAIAGSSQSEGSDSGQGTALKGKQQLGL